MYRLKFILSRFIQTGPRIVLAVLAAAVLEQHAYSQGQSRSERILGRVGDRFIDEREFLERFELTPGLHRRPGAGSREEKEAVVYSLIAEKLLAMEGADAGLDKDPSFLEAFLEVRKLVARDQLYREEITRKVQVSKPEITTAAAQSRRQLTVSFIFSEDRAAVEFIRKQIRKSSEYDSIVIDSSMGILRDTATVIWGDADWDIERAVYQLEKNSVSQVIGAGSGFYLLKVLKEEPSQYFISLSPDGLQQEIARTIRLRKERVRLDQFVRTALKDRSGYAFRESVRKTARAIASGLELPEFRSDSVLTSDVVDAVRGLIEDNLSDSMAVAGTVVWTIEDVLQKLGRASLRLESREARSVFALLNRQLLIWVQQELLAQEALQRRLDESPECIRKLAVWRDAMLAAAVKGRLTGGVEVTDADMWLYAGPRWNLRVPSVTIRELWTSSLPRIQEALGELQKGRSFRDVVMDYSEDAGKSGGGIATFPVTSRAPLGLIALSLPDGGMHGPLKLGQKYLLFELMGKDTLTFPGSGMTGEQIEEAKREALRMKQRAMLNRFLAAQGKKRGFTIFQDQIGRVEVTSVPMMTFRILGFGGRMMEVPFVDRQLEWLNTDFPDDLIP